MSSIQTWPVNQSAGPGRVLEWVRVISMGAILSGMARYADNAALRSTTERLLERLRFLGVADVDDDLRLPGGPLEELRVDAGLVEAGLDRGFVRDVHLKGKQALFVRRICIGVQKADRDRLDALLLQHVDRARVVRARGAGHDARVLAELPPDFLKEYAAAAEGFVAMPLEVMVRFGRWDDVLAITAVDDPTLPATGVAKGRVLTGRTISASVRFDF